MGGPAQRGRQIHRRRRYPATRAEVKRTKRARELIVSRAPRDYILV
jgi:hypothetical protein